MTTVVVIVDNAGRIPDEHINDAKQPGYLGRLTERFKKEKARTKTILEYFRQEGIISKKLEQMISSAA